MSDTIIAALISAVGSVLVAIIQQARGKAHNDVRAITPAYKRNMRLWYVLLSVLLLWLLLSPGLVHHDFGGTNFIVIPVVLSVLMLVLPIRPLTGASLTLALSAANFLFGPLSNIAFGSRYDTQVITEWDKILLLLIISFGGAAVVSAIGVLRYKVIDGTASHERPAKMQETKDRTSESLTTDLERLAALRKDGLLSDDEFQEAKKRLL